MTSDLLKGYRLRAKLSQWQLSVRAGVARSYLQRLEAGAQHPGREVLESLADAMTLSSFERALLLAQSGFLPLVDEAFAEMTARIAEHWARREL